MTHPDVKTHSKAVDLEDNIREYLHDLRVGEFLLSHKKRYP